MTPYYDSDGITIFHGDCREILPTLDPVDLVLTDPPYGIAWDTQYSRFSKGRSNKQPVANDCGELDLRFLFDSSEQIIFGANSLVLDRVGSLLIWDKRCDDGFAFLSDGEAAYWSEGTGVYIHSVNAQRFRSTNGGHHPTQKPIELMRWCIKKSKATGMICDPFMGSGTTLRAAKDLGRKAIGIELEEKYCEIAAERLRQGVLAFG